LNLCNKGEEIFSFLFFDVSKGITVTKTSASRSSTDHENNKYKDNKDIKDIKDTSRTLKTSGPSLTILNITGMHKVGRRHHGNQIEQRCRHCHH
jgi:hypothetical protein